MTNTADIKLIEGIVQTYLDRLYESDADKIASVFHPTSALTSVTDGERRLTSDTVADHSSFSNSSPPFAVNRWKAARTRS